LHHEIKTPASGFGDGRTEDLSMREIMADLIEEFVKDELPEDDFWFALFIDMGVPRRLN